MSRQIFVSYSRQDLSYVEGLAERLREAKQEVWYDYRIGPGERFDSVIQRAIDEASLVLVVQTKASMSSEWVARELHYASDRGKKIVPLLLEDSDTNLILAGTQRIDVRGDHVPSGALVRQIRELAGIDSIASTAGSKSNAAEGDRVATFGAAVLSAGPAYYALATWYPGGLTATFFILFAIGTAAGLLGVAMRTMTLSGAASATLLIGAVLLAVATGWRLILDSRPNGWSDYLAGLVGVVFMLLYSSAFLVWTDDRKKDKSTAR